MEKGCTMATASRGTTVVTADMTAGSCVNTPGIALCIDIPSILKHAMYKEWYI